MVSNKFCLNGMILQVRVPPMPPLDPHNIRYIRPSRLTLAFDLVSTRAVGASINACALIPGVVGETRMFLKNKLR